MRYSTGCLMGYPTERAYSSDVMGMLAPSPMLAVAAIVTTRTCRCRRGQNQVGAWQLKIFVSYKEVETDVAHDADCLRQL